MCGDFDDHLDDELFERFIAHAGQFGVQPQPGAASGPRELGDESARADYMQALFAAGLKRSVDDASGLPSGERMDALAGQAIVFARLAGFLAGQFPADADLFRTITASLLDGSRETAAD